MRTNGFHRASENSLAFAQKSKELNQNHFVAIHSGIGLGGVVLARQKQGLGALVSAVTDAKIDTRRERYNKSVLAKRQKPPQRILSGQRSAAVGQWARSIVSHVIDVVLVLMGLSVCGAAIIYANRPIIALLLKWQASLSHFEWASAICATVFGSYLAYWLCFFVLVGRTPGQFLVKAKKDAVDLTSRDDANPLIQKV